MTFNAQRRRLLGFLAGGTALTAAGVQGGDVILNTFSYHLTPAAFIFEAGAEALGCPVIPAGPGNTADQMTAIAQYRPRVYVGVPDFLKMGKNASYLDHSVDLCNSLSKY